MGVTEFESNTIELAPDLTSAEWLSTLAHELLHLLRGPVPRRLAATEEVKVRHEMSVLLFPHGIERDDAGFDLSEDDLQRLAARYGIDRQTLMDAVSPPTMPFPTIPAQHDPEA